MRFDDVHRPALLRALSELPEEFCTRDLSESRIVQEAHGAYTGDRNYHSMIGRYLSAYMGDVVTQLDDGPHGGRGARWRQNRAPGPAR